MVDENLKGNIEDQAHLRLDYEKTTDYIKLLTDIRFKLLAFTPVASGVSLAAITIFSDGQTEGFLLPVGILGLMATLGIVIYDLRNTELYDAAIMRAGHIEEDLGLLQIMYVFSWDEITRKDKERFIEFLILTLKFDIDWVKTAKIEKNENRKAIKVFDNVNSLSLTLNDLKTEVILGIDMGRTNKFIAKMENDELKIYQKGGLFKSRPPRYSFIWHDFGLSIVYSAAIIGWTFIIIGTKINNNGSSISYSIFVGIIFIFIYLYFAHYRKVFQKFGRDPKECRRGEHRNSRECRSSENSVENQE